jgi:hydroxymethylglutaryl-CoA lyase
VNLPASVRIVEVGPRDGLQNEAAAVSVATRVALIEALGEAGLPSIEVGSFVSPKWVPQMAATGEVLRALRRRPTISYPVLVPNLQGLEAASTAEVAEIAMFAAASETFSRRNTNCSIEGSLDRLVPVAAAARTAGMRVRGYVSCVLGCPYEGDIPRAAVLRVARALIDMGCYEISLGDTIGVGTPVQAHLLILALRSEIGVERLAVHFHDTYGQALANILACLQAGVTVIDSAVGGLGGCPYAKGATGNVATEDVVYMLDGMGIDTGVDLGRVCAIGADISATLGRPNASRVGRARMAG